MRAKCLFYLWITLWITYILKNRLYLGRKVARLRKNPENEVLFGKEKKSLKSPKNGQNGHFCFVCQRKTCLKTKKICFRLEKYLKKNVEIKFWHGTESYLPNESFVLMQNKLYGIDNQGVRKDIT